MKMKRNLIALAVSGAASAAMVAPAIAGDVTVYGRAQVEITSISNQTEGASCSAPNAKAGGNGGCDGIDMADNAMGRVGFKASEDLGNGWKGLAKFEFKADTADGSADTATKGTGTTGISLTGRETMVGLKGSAVQIELGRLKSAYKYAGGVKYDAFVATALEARNGNGGMSHGALGHSSFVSKHLGVQGGSGPIKFRLTYGAEDGDGSMTASAMYKQGNMEAFVALADAGDSQDNGGGQEYSATKIGGAFTTGPHKIMLQIESTDNGTTEPGYTFVGYQMKMGKNIFVAQLGEFDSDGGANDTGMVTLGVIHKFTKKTRVFAGFRQSDADNDSNEDVVSVGVRKDF